MGVRVQAGVVQSSPSLKMWFINKGWRAIASLGARFSSAPSARSGRREPEARGMLSRCHALRRELGLLVQEEATLDQLIQGSIRSIRQMAENGNLQKYPSGSERVSVTFRC